MRFFLFTLLFLAALPPAFSGARPVIILSVEGGGLRGIIPAVQIAEIEKALGRPITQIVDFFAGTSVGSIVVSFLTLKDHLGNQKYSAQHLVDIWPALGKRIFPKNMRNKTALKGLTRPQYSKKPLEAALLEYTGDATLGEALKPLLITSVDLNHEEIYNFYCEPFEPLNKCHIKVRDAVRASTAAPTFFHLHPLRDPSTGKERMLTDGGLVAMTPDFPALREAKILFPGRQILLISLSTGRSRADNRLRVKGPGAGSLPRILQPFIGGMLSTQIELVKKMLASELRANYIRIETPLGSCSSAMDDSSPKNLQCLEKQAKLKIQSEKFQNLLTRLRGL